VLVLKRKPENLERGDYVSVEKVVEETKENRSSISKAKPKPIKISSETHKLKIPLKIHYDRKVLIVYNP